MSEVHLFPQSSNRKPHRLNPKPKPRQQSLFTAEKGANLDAPDILDVMKKQFMFALVW
jgi:hypothetical protein